MKKGIKHYETTIVVDNLELGESIEDKMKRVTQTKEPIENVAPLIYTDRKDGVLPECDIRTDRFDVAMEAMSAVEKSITAKRQQGNVKQNEETQGNVKQNEEKQE